MSFLEPDREPLIVEPVRPRVTDPFGPAFPSAGGRTSTAGTSRDGVGHLAGLDGLRAIAVLAVILYHAGLGWLPGGSLGVQVFFVISGYLITGLLLAEWRRTGGIDLPAFWLRRARRLLPALFFLLALTLAAAVVLLPDEVAHLRIDAAAAVAYVTNWYLISGQQSYFETVGRPSLFLHLWSLAIEEQFYLLWPIVLSVGLLFFRRGAVLLLTLLLAFDSAVLMAVLFVPDVDPSRLYYGTDTRLSGLLVGAALAFVWVPRRAPLEGPSDAADLRAGVWQSRRVAILLDAVAVVGLASMGWFFVATDDVGPFLYMGGFTLLAVITAAVIAGAVHPLGRVGRVLDVRPLSWIGIRSYSIYLWYWPVFVMLRPGLDVPLGPLPLLPVRLGITFLLAEVSYRFVETPVRRGALGRAWTSWREEARDRRWGYLRWPAPAAGGFALAASAVLVSVALATPAAVPGYLATESIQGVVMPAPGSGATGGAGADGGAAGSADAAGAVGSGGVADAVGAAGPGGAADAADGVIVASPVPDALVPSGGSPPVGSGLGSLLPPLTPSGPATDAAAVGPGAGPVSPGGSAASADPSGAPGAAAETPTSPTPASPAPTGPARPDIFALGDSVMIDAAPALARLLGPIEVDASVGRHVNEGVRILERRASAGTLPDTVIVQLGNNGPFRGGDFADAMRALRGVRLVIWVNLTVPRDWEAWNNGVLASGVPQYANARLVDWHAASDGHPELFWDDGFHPRPPGAALFARLVVAALAP
jgi:peptidoglycan/LPS O-acetylase OafA/YrhL